MAGLAKIGTAITLVVVLGACGTDGRDEPETVVEPTSVTLRLDFAIDGLHAPFFVALDQGFYEEAGLDVAIEPGQGSADTVRVVGAGTAEFGVADAGTALRSIADDVPIKATAILLRSHPGVMVALQDSGITDPADLRGKSVGDAQEASTTVLLPAFLEANGLQMEDINFVGMTFPARVPALLNAQVDVIGGFLQEFVNIEDEVVFIRWADHGIEAYGSSIIVHTGFMEENPEAVRAFVQASMRGLEHSLDNVTEAGQIVARAAEGDEDYFIREIELLEPLYRGPEGSPAQLGVMAREPWEATQRLMLDHAEQSREVDLDEAYTNEFVER